MGNFALPGAIPYVPSTYDYRPDHIADLIMRQGDIAAQRQERSGQIWGNAVNQVGQIAGQAFQKNQELKNERAVGEAVSAATKNASGSDDMQSILSTVSPELRPRVMKGIEDFHAAADMADERRARIQAMQRASQQADLDAVGTLAHHIIKNKFLDGPDGGLGAMTTAVTIAKQRHLSVASNWDKEISQFSDAMKQAQSMGDPGAVEAVAATGRKLFGPALQQLEMSMSQEAQDRIKKNEAPIKGAPGDVFFDPETKQPVMSVPEKPPNLQHVETDKGIQLLNPKTGELGPVIAKGKPAASTIVNAGTEDDATAIGDAIIAGEQPPDTRGLYRAGPKVRAYLAKKGFNLATAFTDWQATQKHVASLNNAQQTRLNQSINALPDLLDSVDAIASKWKGGKFPTLNKANLALAKGGAYGPEVASVANQLETQIADVVSDLGNVYMGGNSPTDHALGLAGKSLSAEWDEKVLHDMVKLAKSNVLIRRNSINTTGVAGASAGNPYGAQPVAPPTPPAGKVDPLGLR
jgi:hypothetical protein